MTWACRILAFVMVVFIGALAECAEPQLLAVAPMGVSRTEPATLTLNGTGLKATRQLLFSLPGIRARREGDGVFRVEVTGDGAGRDGDLWAVTPEGLSNPRRMTVGDLAETVEREPNNTAETAQDIELGTVVNAAIDPATDRDVFRFALEAGRRVAIAFRSESLEGSVRPALTVVSPDGIERLHDAGGEAEPTLSFVAGDAGRYLVRVEDRSYRRNAFSTYRLEISSGPRILAAFPSVLTRGKSQEVSLFGYELPAGEPAGAGCPPGLQRVAVTIDAPTVGDPDGGGWTLGNAAMLEGFRYQHPKTRGAVRFTLVDQAVTAEIPTSHERAESAQPIESGQVVSGRFLLPGEVDWYRFSARKGATLWLEAMGERTGQAMDLDMAILDGRGKLVQSFADTAQPREVPVKLPLDTLDPMGSWKVPADGEYLLVVRDLYGTIAHGPQRGYVLTIGPRREGFRVVAVPGGAKTPLGLSVPRGGTAELELVAIRRGGHEGPITIRARDLPPGLTVREATIPAKQSTGKLAIGADIDAPEWVGLLTLESESSCQGETLRNPLVATWPVRQARTPLSRLCSGLAATIVGTPPGSRKKESP